MAVLLREHANFPVDLEKAITMLLIHDIVEIDAGDSFLYSTERSDAHAKERLAAQRIFWHAGAHTAESLPAGSGKSSRRGV